MENLCSAFDFWYAFAKPYDVRTELSAERASVAEVYILPVERDEATWVCAAASDVEFAVQVYDIGLASALM